MRVKKLIVGVKIVVVPLNTSLRLSHRTRTQQPCSESQTEYFLCSVTSTETLAFVSGGRKTRLSPIGGQPDQEAAGWGLDLIPQGCYRGSWEPEGGGSGGGAGGWRGG